MDNVGLLQAQAGAMLLKKWRFPDSMVDAIGGQDDPTKLETENWLAEGLHFASELLPQGIGAPYTPSEAIAWTPSPSADEFMSRHELTQTDVESLLKSTSESFESIRRHFGA
jgi:HD-like signal output (HDOD) protein